MADSAVLKIHRAAKHIDDLTELFRKKAPFNFVVETNVITRQRSARAKANVSVVETAALICGDVVHNLRTALDHAYWEIISPFVANPTERERLQFPFGKKWNGFKGSMGRRFTARGGFGFICAMVCLKPYLENGGNQLLYLIHEMDIIDKHKLLVPTASVTEIPVEALVKHFPDFPDIFRGQGIFSLHGPKAGFNWTAGNISRDEIGNLVPPSLHMFERTLDIPIDVIFDVGPRKHDCRVIPSLNAMVDVAKEVIAIMRRAVASY